MENKIVWKEIQPSLYEIESFTQQDMRYIADLLEKSCSCPSFKFRGFCKHLKVLLDSSKPEPFLPSRI